MHTLLTLLHWYIMHLLDPLSIFFLGFDYLSAILIYSPICLPFHLLVQLISPSIMPMEHLPIHLPSLDLASQCATLEPQLRCVSTRVPCRKLWSCCEMCSNATGGSIRRWWKLPLGPVERSGTMRWYWRCRVTRWSNLQKKRWTFMAKMMGMKNL